MLGQASHSNDGTHGLDSGNGSEPPRAWMMPKTPPKPPQFPTVLSILLGRRSKSLILAEGVLFF